MIQMDDASLTSPEGQDVRPDTPEVFKPKKRIPYGAIFGIVWVGALLILTILAHYFPAALPFVRDYDTRVKVNGRTTSYGLGPGWTVWWGLERARTTCSPAASTAPRCR
ncbi:MAG: hypothetical protein QM733_16030 [Ilumatobacteraceae bacterium]